ncbi:MATE family efflux transporter [Paenibacillus sp.]|uniref:MATE family efflux transporter n=1 Tax=Paenibacillus sp. TaxID=58172 RepID=UPI0028125151|nr:MATE family efflux transporter [Paenibacillus sp.]
MAVGHALRSILNRYFTGNSMDYKQTFGIILPIFVDNAFLIIMSLLNTAMIGSAGVAAISAVSMVESLNLFIVNLFLALAAGGTVIVAQYKGGGRHEMVSKAVSQAVSLVTIVSVVISVSVIVFHAGILKFLFGGAEAEVFDNARIFLIGSCLTFPLLGAYQAVSGALRGVGATKVSLFLSVIMNLTNFVLNIVFIVLMDLGVVGLVFSLIAARIVGVAASMYYLIRHSPNLHFQWSHLWKLDGTIAKKIVFIGVPFAMEQMFFNGGKLLTQTYIVQFGTMALTVNAIGSTIAGVYQIGANALSIAIVTVVGQSIGRKDIQDARKFVKSFMGLSTIWFGLATAVILPFFPYLVRLFSPPEDIIPTVFTLVVLIAIAQPLFWTLSFLLPSALRAAGDSNYTSITALLTMWLVRVVLGYLLGVTFGFGIIGVWVAMIVEWGVRGLFFAWRFKGDKWYRHNLV